MIRELVWKILRNLVSVGGVSLTGLLRVRPCLTGAF